MKLGIREIIPCPEGSVPDRSVSEGEGGGGGGTGGRVRLSECVRAL
jgi:hypothetical protein